MGRTNVWCSLVVNGWKTGKVASRRSMIPIHLWFWFQALWISALSLFLCYYPPSWLFVSISSCLSFWVAFLMQRSGFFGSKTGEALQYLELLRKSDLICEWFYLATVAPKCLLSLHGRTVWSLCLSSWVLSMLVSDLCGQWWSDWDLHWLDWDFGKHPICGISSFCLEGDLSLANAFLNERDSSIHFVALSPSRLLVVLLDGETHFWPRT